MNGILSSLTMLIPTVIYVGLVALLVTRLGGVG